MNLGLTFITASHTVSLKKDSKLLYNFSEIKVAITFCKNLFVYDRCVHG